MAHDGDLQLAIGKRSPKEGALHLVSKGKVTQTDDHVIAEFSLLKGLDVSAHHVRVVLEHAATKATELSAWGVQAGIEALKQPGTYVSIAKWGVRTTVNALATGQLLTTGHPSVTMPTDFYNASSVLVDNMFLFGRHPVISSQLFLHQCKQWLQFHGSGERSAGG